jgi:hypothetical protein
MSMGRALWPSWVPVPPGAAGQRLLAAKQQPSWLRQRPHLSVTHVFGPDSRILA